MIKWMLIVYLTAAPSAVPERDVFVAGGLRDEVACEQLAHQHPGTVHYCKWYIAYIADKQGMRD